MQAPVESVGQWTVLEWTVLDSAGGAIKWCLCLLLAGCQLSTVMQLVGRYHAVSPVLSRESYHAVRALVPKLAGSTCLAADQQAWGYHIMLTTTA